jgi:hypothetical protein
LIPKLIFAINNLQNPVPTRCYSKNTVKVSGNGQIDTNSNWFKSIKHNLSSTTEKNYSYMVHAIFG